MRILNRGNRWPLARHARRHVTLPVLLIGVATMFLFALAGCGSSSTSSSAGSMSGLSHSYQGSSNTSSGGASGVNYGASSNTGNGQTGNITNPGQYLTKSLEVDMEVKDTRAVAIDLQHYITATDPKATSAGATYQQVSDNLYTVTLTFSVESTLYPQIEQYLASYSQQHDGHLLSLRESVQDVTNDYIDTQSRLTNLRAELQRLNTLMGQAQNLSDTLTVEQRVTDVEGEIESIEAHLNDLQGQLTFYPVTINLEPVESTTIQPQSSWNPGQTLHDALLASLAFGEGLVSFLIWVAAFAIYLLPVILVAWLTRRLMRIRRVRRAAPPATPLAPSSTVS